MYDTIQLIQQIPGTLSIWPLMYCTHQGMIWGIADLLNLSLALFEHVSVEITGRQFGIVYIPSIVSVPTRWPS